MRKLYEISEAYNNIYDLLDNEEVPIEVIEDALEQIEVELEEKFDNIASLIKMFEGKVEIYKQEESRIKQRRQVYENRVKSLKNYVMNQLDYIGKSEIEGDRFTVRKQKSPKSIDVDESQLDKKYLIPQPSKVDRRLIGEELKAGKKVKGAKYKPTSYHIRIQ